MNNIHIYINEPESKKDYQISINDTNDIVNGTCDSIIFQELNYLDIKDIDVVLKILFDKLSYNGICFCQINHMESIINDYNFHKIDEKEFNKIVMNGRRNLLTETTMLDHFYNAGFMIKNFIYDNYLLKLQLVKNNK